jgi:hypothetical protein
MEATSLGSRAPRRSRRPAAPAGDPEHPVVVVVRRRERRVVHPGPADGQDREVEPPIAVRRRLPPAMRQLVRHNSEHDDERQIIEKLHSASLSNTHRSNHGLTAVDADDPCRSRSLRTQVSADGSRSRSHLQPGVQFEVASGVAATMASPVPALLTRPRGPGSRPRTEITSAPCLKVSDAVNVVGAPVKQAPHPGDSPLKITSGACRASYRLCGDAWCALLPLRWHGSRTCQVSCSRSSWLVQSALFRFGSPGNRAAGEVATALIASRVASF